MRVKLLLKQHVGAPSSPMVSVGDQVERGQRIAKREGLGANIHSSLSGEVVAVTDEYIEIDGEKTDSFLPIEASDNLLDMVEAAGIVGAGGAGFPAHVKLNISLPGGYIIANAAECEPVLHHNITMLETEPEKVISGLLHAKKMISAEHAYVAIKAKYTQAIKAIKKVKDQVGGFELKILPDMYPSGDERVIVREILGVELEPGALPSVAHAVIQNVETLKRIAEAIDERKPFIDKDMTVGGRVRNANSGLVFLDQPIGRRVVELIEECGGYQEPHGEIVLGGPFTGATGGEESIITKTMGAVLVAMPFPTEKSKMGLLVCECGASEQRMRDIATGMGAEIVAVEHCKRMTEVGGRVRCELPGVCPGQAEKILLMRKKGMDAILAGTCGD